MLNASFGSPCCWWSCQDGDSAVLMADVELPFGLRGPKIRLAFEPNRGLCHLLSRSGLRILISALSGQQKTLWTILV
jgi:hypothetical protein